MKPALSQPTEVLTAVSIQSGWIRLLQARRDSRGLVSLTGLKAKKVPGTGEDLLAQALGQMLRSLPASPMEAVGIFSSDAVFTRYLSLPSSDPNELQAMALYQLEGMVPYPLDQCVVSVKPMGPMGEATRVLAVVAHRPDLERLIRVCRAAGLRLTRIASATEGIGRWHQACWPEGAPASAGWLAAEITQEGVELGVFLGGSLLYVRHLPHVAGDLEEFAARLEETVQAYEKERVGPKIERVTVSGRLDRLPLGALERLEAVLGLSVHVVDPLEKSPFKDALVLAAHEVAPEISFSDLLGVVCVPRLLELDLLPLESRVEQAREHVYRQARRTAAGLALAALVLAGWAGLRTCSVFWFLRQSQAEIRALQPQVDRIQRRAEVIRDILSAQELYARQIRSISSAARRLAPGMALQFLGLEGKQVIVLRGTAPDLAAVTGYSASLREDPAWEKVTLRAARVNADRGEVEFEMALFPKE